MCAAELPKQLLLGARVVELGAGPGLPGLFAASCGAVVTITDLAKVVPLIQQNIQANAVAVGNKTLAEHTTAALQGSKPRSMHSSNRCVAAALQWGTEAGMQQAQLLGSQGVDYVMACDTCYIDPVRCTHLLQRKPCCMQAMFQPTFQRFEGTLMN